MGIDITRLQQKKADGSYDIVHPETQAKAVWMSDGRSVEEALGEGGYGVLEVTFDVDFSTGVVSNASHTFAQISAAVSEGKVVVAKFISLVYQLCEVTTNYFMFDTLTSYTSVAERRTVAFYADGTADHFRTPVDQTGGSGGGGAGLLRVVVESDMRLNMTNGEVTFTTPTVSHTFQQIEDAMNAGKIIDALVTGHVYYTGGDKTGLGATQTSILQLEAVTHYTDLLVNPYGSAWFANSACVLEIYDDGTPPSLRSNI